MDVRTEHRRLGLFCADTINFLELVFLGAEFVGFEGRVGGAHEWNIRF